MDTVPSPEIQHLLCTLLGLVLNRKKPVEYVSPNEIDAEERGAVIAVATTDSKRRYNG